MRPNALLVLFATGLLACSAGNDKGTDSLGGNGNGTDNDGGPSFDLDGGPGGLDADPSSLDPSKDNDGDGFLFADDCNDLNKDVNPGAFDVLGDGVDNDCDGKVDNAPDCDTTALKMTSTDAMDLAKAMGLCRVSDGKKWGVVSAEILRADGSKGADALQYGILTHFGSVVKPRAGSNLVALSSGTARNEGDSGAKLGADSYHSTGAGSTSANTPAGWPKNSTGCPTPLDNKAQDSVNLKLKIKVPTNAHGFSYSLDFYSSEYIHWVCSEFNDSFVALLQTGAMLDPKNAGNISFDSMGSPINVNSGFFEICTPATSSKGKKFACGKGTSELGGTLYPAQTDLLGDAQDGATGWLVTKAPAIPGETITLQFMIWDTSDQNLDSTILLDDFQWDAMGTTAPVTDRPK